MELNFLLSHLPRVNDFIIGLNDSIQQIFNECLLWARNSSFVLTELANSQKGNMWISKKIQMDDREKNQKKECIPRPNVHPTGI